MAQVVRPQGFIAPIILLIVGAVLLFNGVPALFQWLGWVMQSSLAIGLDSALESAAAPLLISAGATLVGALMVRGGWGSLMSLARTASKRAHEQARTGAQQVRHEVDLRRGQVTSQAEHLQNRVPQSWRERIDAAAREVESERARRSGQQPQVFGQSQGRGPLPGQQQQRPQGAAQPAGAYQQRAPQGYQQRASEGYQQRAPQGHAQQAQQGYRQQPPQQRPAAQPAPRQQAPGTERLSRVEELRQEVAARAQQAGGLQDAGTQAAGRLKQAALDEAARVQQRQLPNPSDEVAALIDRLDAANTERVRRRGSSLTRSSLSTSALSKTSLRLNSLLQRRH